MRALILLAFLALACGKDTPVPEYPFPEGEPLEDTDLAQYFGEGDSEEDDEEWDDGLSDEDLQMDGDATPPEEPAPEAETADAMTPAATE
ncbi:MAG: hypothetical protein AAGE52_33645 [Myxococcota bacterium]